MKKILLLAASIVVLSLNTVSAQTSVLDEHRVTVQQAKSYEGNWSVLTQVQKDSIISISGPLVVPDEIIIHLHNIGAVITYTDCLWEGHHSHVIRGLNPNTMQPITTEVYEHFNICRDCKCCEKEGTDE